MKITRYQLLRLIKEELSTHELEYQRSMEASPGEAGRHLDDLFAREAGYEDSTDQDVDQWIQAFGKEHETTDKINQMTRAEVGLPDTFSPSNNFEFISAMGNAKKAIASGNEEEFLKNYHMMRNLGPNIDSADRDEWKMRTGVASLIQHYEDITGQNSFFNLERSPVLKSLGLAEHGKIKITKRQLDDIISEALLDFNA